ncbi:stage IV sporulation protein A [Lachnoclostridium phytofermentans]|uniref:Stage IV sporulation protein A n=1 Tax=Lachnoclostridium phytofermentans (strain ATCC 700394 / DSM 18823 / ISDg) TaxID=357809 RepID=A9KLK2_LACP7|nr:stage IV sporulation protein A [Lachnoclostridium phytofermentans]ABX42746.1 stage IV sporulation protein A [Lachnoclostridium phytofermentans ISDg]
MDNFNVYKDIKARTNGEIYIGVVGPVRTGKSTFIKRFMDLIVIPNIEDVHSRERAIDELPQSAQGKTVMTTEPKFIPKEAVDIQVLGDVDLSVRMIDCVGYMVEGALGHTENEQERLVKTPWFDYEIPFTQAAELGTKKVINDHSTIGIVVTCDGSFGEIPRDNYVVPEERTIEELKRIGKPFVVLLNSNHPLSEDTKLLSEKLSEKYDVMVMPINCEQLKKEDINKILSNVLSVFPITEISFYLPKWIEMFPRDHYIKKSIIETAKEMLRKLRLMKDVNDENCKVDNPYINEFKVDKMVMEDGSVRMIVDIDNRFYYDIISEMTGIPVSGEYEFMKMIKELAARKQEYEKVSSACEQVKHKGYGVVSPSQNEIVIEEPQVIRHGNKYGVKIKANAPSVHMIQANIETEIAPIVGTEEQALDLIAYMKEQAQTSPEGIWETNIFGKTMKQLVDEGIASKINKMNDDSQMKLQETMQRIINESNGGLICIII